MKYEVCFDVVVEGPGDSGSRQEASFRGILNSPGLPHQGELFTLKFERFANMVMKVVEVEHVLSVPSSSRRGVATHVVYLEERRFRLDKCNDADLDEFWEELKGALKIHGFEIEE